MIANAFDSRAAGRGEFRLAPWIQGAGIVAILTALRIIPIRGAEEPRSGPGGLHRPKEAEAWRRT